jgi:hypothetical protein
VCPSKKQPARRHNISLWAHLQDISQLTLTFFCFWVNYKKCISLKPILFFNSFTAHVDESTSEHADMSCHIILLYLCNAWLHYVSLFFMTCRK